MKNPDNKPLRIKTFYPDADEQPDFDTSYGIMLSNLAIAESNLVRAGKDSALNHFIAIVKELERVYGFSFEIMEE